MPKFFSVEKAAKLLHLQILMLDDPEIDILPPEDVNSVTNKENINEDCLGHVGFRDVLGFVEIHHAPGEMPQSSILSENQPLKKWRQSKLNWKKGESLNGNNVSTEMVSEPQDLREKHPILSTLYPIDLYKLFFLYRIP